MSKNELSEPPLVRQLPESATASDLVKIVQEDGAVIVNNLMAQALADQIEKEMQDYIAATPFGSGFTGHKTTRTGALVSRSPACRELITNKTILGATDLYLSPFCERVQLHLTQIIRICPGQSAQFLHRDRAAWGGFIPVEIQPQLNMIWALTDFTKDNGATRVVPGSHLWDYERKAEPAEITFAEMPRGSVLIYSGSVIHGGGENVSTTERMGINITYSLGWLRQEENQFLSCPPDVARDMEPELQELLGYTMGSLACGYYSQLLPPGEAKEVCPPEYSLGRKPRPGMNFEIMTG